VAIASLTRTYGRRQPRDEELTAPETSLNRGTDNEPRGGLVATSGNVGLQTKGVQLHWIRAFAIGVLAKPTA
jgi:hypothetical protein